MQKPSWQERLRYRIDNALSRGTLILIGWLALATLVMVVAMTVLSLLPGVRPENTGLKEIFWDVLFQALTPNPFDVTAPLLFLLVMLVVTLGSLFMVSILIGILTTGIENRIELLRRGRSRVLEKEHTIILGWSHQVYTVISELVIANENRKQGAVIAILADKDKVEMETAIRERIPNTENTHVICRSGSPIDPTDLEIVSPHTARSIIILPPESDDPDTFVIKTILAITNNPHRRAAPYHIITQIRDENDIEVVQMLATRDDIHAIQASDVIARVTAQTSRQSGLSMVYTELLNFSGDEIYFKEEPTLSGKTFGDALFAYEDSAVVGLRFANGTIKLNPPMDTRLAPGDKVIAISADDDTVILSGRTTFPVHSELIRLNSKPEAQQPERGLIVNWNRAASTIVNELDYYVAKGSSLTVFADDWFESAVHACNGLKRQKLSFHAGNTTDRRTIDELDFEEYDHVIVLADTTRSVQEADARALITLLHLRDIADHLSAPFSIVSEMLDLRNRALAEVARVDDFIVSDHLISLMMSQLSENGELYEVFNDLFDPEGSEIYLKPISDYAVTGQPVNFYTLLESARRRGEVAIGYRLLDNSHNLEQSYGVCTNPKKMNEITFKEHDKIIVLAEQ